MMDADIENVSRAQSLIVDCLGMIIKETIHKPLSQTTKIMQTQSSKHKADAGQGTLHLLTFIFYLYFLLFIIWLYIFKYHCFL
jgi:hypothetical protein